MEKINLLDMNNDILNIIGAYVKKDNLKKFEIFNFIDEEIKINKSKAKEEKRRLTKNHLLANVYFFVYYKFYINDLKNDNWRIYNEIRNNEFLPIYEEYVTLKKSGFFKKNKKYITILLIYILPNIYINVNSLYPTLRTLAFFVLSSSLCFPLDLF